MLIILYIVRVLSLSVNPMLRMYINLSKQHRLCLRRKLPKDMGGGPPSQRSAIAKVSDKNYDDCRIFKKASFLSFHDLTDHRATCIRANSDEEL